MYATCIICMCMYVCMYVCMLHVYILACVSQLSYHLYVCNMYVCMCTVMVSGFLTISIAVDADTRKYSDFVIL